MSDAAVGLFVSLLDVGFALRRRASKNSRRSLALGSVGRGGKDAVHGTLLRGQRPFGRRGGVEVDFDQNLSERKKRTEGRTTPTGGGEGEGGAAGLCTLSRQRLSLSIIQFARPRPYIFFNGSETTRGIVTLPSSAVFCRSGDSRCGVNPPPPGYTPATTPPPTPRHLSSG